MTKRPILTFLLALVATTSVAQPPRDSSSQPSAFGWDLSDIAAWGDNCRGIEPMQLALGVDLNAASCEKLSASAGELEAVASDRGISEFDRRLMAENLLYLSRNTALDRQSAVLAPEDVSFFGIGFLLDYIGLGRSRCFLRVDSDPKRSEVHIDSQFKGYTFQRYVLNPGEHRVVVENKSAGLHCEETLVIERDREASVFCPEKDQE